MLLGLAIDPVEDKLYISNACDEKIEVVRVNGIGKKTFITCAGFPCVLTMDLKER